VIILDLIRGKKKCRFCSGTGKSMNKSFVCGYCGGSKTMEIQRITELEISYCLFLTRVKIFLKRKAKQFL
jgi:Zn finger protein HypA/HybF involved in hydrogenase expression